jgi:hypothetical protein
MMETKYFFEELQLPEFGEGALFYGEAVLVDNRGETDSFIVQDIKLGANWLPRAPYDGARTIGQQMFKAISDVLYDEKTVNGRHAALEWADFVEGNTPAVPMFKPRAGLLALIVEGADMRGSR